MNAAPKRVPPATGAVPYSRRPKKLQCVLRAQEERDDADLQDGATPSPVSL